ncbi:MAG: YCF48-related protein [Ignavibacteria bacterium]
MKKILLLFPLVLLSVNVNSQWFEQTSGTTNILNSGYFINVNTGFLCGYGGTVLKTTNGGTNWSSAGNIPIYSLKSICFKDSQTGFACGEGQSDYILIYTTNSGSSWQIKLNIPFNHAANNILFINAMTGFIAGKGIPYKTTDGGNTWNIFLPEIGTSHKYIISSFSINTDKIFWVGTHYNPPYSLIGKIYYTTNGGANFLETTLPTSQIQDISFYDGLNGFIVALGYFGRTTDGGSSWTYINSPPLFANSVSYSSVQTLYRASNYDIYYSTSGGLNWSAQHHESTRILNFVKMVNVNTGYCIGYNGLILKTTNGGITTVQPISSEIPKQFSLSQNYPNPFNPTTKIRFDIRGNSATQTFLSVYDILGREVATLVNEELKPGTYEVNWDGSNIVSGVYFYKLSTPDFTATKKMMLIK